jgi:hypothetical protein
MELSFKYSILRITSVILFMFISLTAFGQRDSLEVKSPLRFDNINRISPDDRVPEDSILVFFNNKFYRYSEIDVYDKMIDGVSIETLAVVKNKDSIRQFLNSKIKVLLIINQKKDD